MNRTSPSNFFAASLTSIAFALLALAAPSHVSAQTDGFTESVLLSVGFDGVNPSSGLILAADGNFYGTTSSGGSQYDGAVYKVTPSGTASTVYSFCVESRCADGQFPGGLIQGSDGNFYGTTTNGGVNGGGIAYKLTPSGTLTVLYAFCAVYTNNYCQDGSNPGGLVQGTDGNFYGVAGGGANTYGGGNQGGIVFQLTPAGKLTVLHSFCSEKSCADGGLPSSGLVQASDGNFYGTAASGGANGGGVAYKINASGAFSVVYSFCYTPGAPCADGPGPSGTLVEAADTSFYGVTTNGGPNTANGNGYGGGTIFQLTTGGKLTTLYDFCSQTNCTDGYAPSAGLYLASDGNFYGSTARGNTQPLNDGVFFQLSGSTFTPVYIFCSQRACADGEDPESGVIQGTDGAFYGTTEFGGAYSDGTVFKLTHSPALKAPVQLSLGQSSITIGSSTTLAWSVTGAYSQTLQQCYAFVQNGATGAGSSWSGKNPGGGTTSGSVTIQPTAGGTFTYALTCGGVESGFATLNVTKPPTTTTLVFEPTSPTVGQSVTLKATVAGADGTPTGSVTFSVDGESLATESLKSGVATVNASTNGIAPATYPVIATYSGSSSYNSSASSATNVPLAKAPTTTTLTASPTSVTPPASVTLTATVVRSAAGATGAPTGSVTFYGDGSTALGTVKLNASGVATVTASSKGYAAATYAITAKYTGDSADSDSTSTAVNVTVQ
jgi:uncharacterized repeat protein (TIGR03803 family)